MSGIFEIASNPEVFEREAKRFKDSVQLVDNEAQLPRRRDRAERVGRSAVAAGFVNEPDTDPAMPADRSAMALAVARGASLTRWPKALEHELTQLTSVQQIDELIIGTRLAQQAWALDHSQRERVLLLAADKISERRNDLISVMVAEAGKTATEADPEISEAIDFGRFYAKSIDGLANLDGTRFVPNRLTVVVPPWNFPVAIAAGGVFAALAAGSSVVLKAAPQVPACAQLLAQILWDAGVPRDVLKAVSVEDGPLGLALVGHLAVDSVVLTGSYETAQLFKEHQPEIKLSAETSGKNCMIITPSADLDLAAAALAKSAFGHAGQKCSAASVAILVGSVRKSKAFERQLVDAVKSMRVGRDAAAVIGPLIEPPTGKLLRALTQLDAGERWLLKPEKLDDTGHSWSPGIRIGVGTDAWIAKTEVFGPVLAIVHAKNLKRAIELQNSTEFGLTAGLQSLNTAEQKLWLQKVRAGNLYINRTITGAVVERQPFGGMKRSSVGWGLKAGGLNYLFNFGHWADELLHYSPVEWLERATLSDQRWMRERFGFGAQIDRGTLKSETNLKRYQATPVVVRIGQDVAEGHSHILRIKSFIKTAKELGGVNLDVTFSRGNDRAARLLENPPVGLRVIVVGEPDSLVNSLRKNLDVTIFENAVVADGLLTGLMLLREQSVSITNHRFGSILQEN